MKTTKRRAAFRVPVHIQDYDRSGPFSQLSGTARTQWPVRVGVPFAEGQCVPDLPLELRDGKQRIPFQTTVTSRWPDGSVRWLSLLALVDLQVSERKTLILSPVKHQTLADGIKSVKARTSGERNGFAVPAGTVTGSAPCACPVVPGTMGKSGMQEGAHTDRFSIGNGRITVATTPALDQLEVCAGDEPWTSSAPRFELELDGGAICQVRWHKAEPWTDGPLRGGLVFSGAYVAPDGREEFAAEFRIELTAGQSWIECRHRLVRQVPGGGAATVRRLTTTQSWELDASVCLLRQISHGEEWLPRDVRQSGSVRVQITAQAARVADHAMVHEDPLSYPPYLQRGLNRVEPWLAATDARRLVLFWSPEPSGQSPQEWTVANGRFVIDFIPASSPPAVFPQGRAATHRWRWHLAPAPTAASPLRPQDRAMSAIEPLALLHEQAPLASVDPAWARACGAAHTDQSLTWMPARHPRFEAMLNHLFDLKWPKGMMDWGDDVEPGYTQSYSASGNKPPGAVWTNNEYDFIYATLHQMLRTGQGRLWATAERSARHAMDTDFIHYSDDPWLHHGSPAHCAGHTTAASYPSHIWTEGLLLYYYLSADAEALATSRHLGTFILRYMTERWWVFEETARESGWALIALSELYAATGEARFLDGARRIADLAIKGTTGSHPLFPGDASFFIGVLVIGLDRLHAIAPDRRIAPAIDRILRWRLDHRLSPEGIPLYHWDAGARMVNTREIIFPGALAIAYRLTRRKRYVEALWRCLQYWLDTNAFYGPPACTKHAAAVYRTWVESFQVLAGAGLLRRLDYASGKR